MLNCGCLTNDGGSGTIQRWYLSEVNCVDWCLWRYEMILFWLQWCMRCRHRVRLVELLQVIERTVGESQQRVDKLKSAECSPSFTSMLLWKLDYLCTSQIWFCNKHVKCNSMRRNSVFGHCSRTILVSDLFLVSLKQSVFTVSLVTFNDRYEPLHLPGLNECRLLRSYPLPAITIMLVILTLLS